MVAADVECEIGNFYSTRCLGCNQLAPVKYFLWVKVETCPSCGTDNDLFPTYLLAEATRHPKHVLVCGECGALNEYDRQPTKSDPQPCQQCGHPVIKEGPAQRRRIQCRKCKRPYPYPTKHSGPPRHRLWALEYHCALCKGQHTGRFFKQPDADDFDYFDHASELLGQHPGLPIPEEQIPAGDETDRLHRWGYRHYHEMFNRRQLLGLGLLLDRIQKVEETETRHALLTVFSDFLRYQNMLCRYDTYALKCQDIFSVHGFPVGLVQCENNLLGIPHVGSGAFRHFVEKYQRAKHYCEAPFETRYSGSRKQIVPIVGEQIGATFVEHIPECGKRQAYLCATSATALTLPEASLDGVFTDPPYFNNVQYAELMDFCFVWLRLGLAAEFDAFRAVTTRNTGELTGNVTLGRDLAHFTAGLSAVFRHYAAALKPGAPFVFTYHHNDPGAYLPLVVAILDAGLDCTATLPAAAEMSASMHIAGTASSILDSVFICRARLSDRPDTDITAALGRDICAMKEAGVSVTAGDIRCLAAGHVARVAVNTLHPIWAGDISLHERVKQAQNCLTALAAEVQVERITAQYLSTVDSRSHNDEAAI